jgi:hypothetical protein
MFDFIHALMSLRQASDRSQSVNIGNIVSTEKILSFGVPQGSVLGPKKYCMFSKPIGQICKRHNMSYHCYAVVLIKLKHV